MAGALAAASLTGTLAAGTAPAYAVDPVVGAQTSGDSLFPHQGNGGYDALHYDVRLKVGLTVSPTPNAVGTTTFLPGTSTTLAAQTTGAPLSQFSLDLQGSSTDLAGSTLTVDSVTVDGVAAGFSRIENTTTTNATTDEHKLVVTPATPVDGTFTTVVTYSGTPVRHQDTDGSSEGWNNTTDGATFLNQPVGSMTAFPNNNTPSDKATYTFTIEAPTTLSTSAASVLPNDKVRTAGVVSNGELLSKTASPDGSRTTWVWDETEPMASELSLVSIGRYDVYESDLVLASGRTLHEWTFIDPAISVQSQMTTLSTRAQLKAALDHLESKYGPYPGHSVGLVTDVVPSAINYALETQDRPFFPTSASRSTTYHEYMHMWFGDSVSPGDWNDIWLNEGPATYAENGVAFESSGASTNPNENSYYTSFNASSPTSSLWTTPTAAMTQASQLFGSQVYTRGSWTLEALRTAIGSLAFAQVMAEWQDRYAGQSRRTSDFVALAEEVSGRELDAFFAPWLYGTTKAAWPAKFTLDVVGPAAPVTAGQSTSYTLTSRNTGKVAQNGSVVTLDLADVLDDATLGSLPAGSSLDGTTLTWTVPSTAVAASSSLVVPLQVDLDATGSTLAAVAQATTLGGTCLTCTTSVVVGADPVGPAPDPTVSGTPTVGAPLGATTDGWAGGTTFAYQWLVDGSPVAGATGATFTPDVYAVGLPVAVRVTGSSGGLSPVTRTSAPTANVVRGAFAASPVPTVTGTPQFGKKLVVDVGTWEAGTYFTYQWAANGTNVTAANGGTGPVFTPLAAAQSGQTLTVTVTATKAGRTTTTRTSAATAPVAAGVFASAPTPSVAGTPRALAPLTAVPGQWDDGTALAYAWSLDGTPVAGATSATFTPSLAQIGQVATVTVTGTKNGYPATARTSDPTAPVGPAAQLLTPLPTITGTPALGQELTAVPGTWDVGVALAYQWTADGDDLPDATAGTYTPVVADVGRVIAVEVTGTRTGYAPVTTVSAPTAAVAPGALTSTPTPTISGSSPQVGVTFTAVPGSWDDGVTLGYQWTSDGSDIAGATAATYDVRPADLGAAVAVVVTGSKAGYATVAKTSAPTSDIEPGDLTSTPTPTITGTARVGQVLTAVPGSWDSGVTLGYQWTADGTDLPGATGSAYTPVPGDVGAALEVVVTGSKAGYATVAKTSAPTSDVDPGDLTSTPTPTITGTARVGQTLTAVPGSWDGGVSLGYQWTSGGSDVPGATASTYVPTSGDVGAVLRVEVTGSKNGYTTVTRESAPTAVVTAGALASTPLPTVAGTPMFGEQLTAVTGTWDAGTVLTYQWLVDGNPVAAAVGAAYQVRASDVGRTVAVSVTGTRPGYTPVTRTSGATTPVVARPFDQRLEVTLKGKAKVGRTLRAVTGPWPVAATVTYEWLVGGEVKGAARAFAVKARAEGRRITVRVTVTMPGYTTQTDTARSARVRSARVR